ncbi:glutaredoxin family protein [Candidatus Deferrimicrobium sp.]|uniref:glutaredoxin family protein n=1 Tax=Candidatus Deferrimicrobium sp. TaxID=3060586 RepID=UPI002EDB8F7B
MRNEAGADAAALECQDICETLHWPGGKGGNTVEKKIVVYTTPWCGDCKAAKRFLEERGISYEEVDIERTPEAAEIVRKLNDGMRKVPTLDVEGTIVSGDKFDAARFEKDLRAAGAL